MSWHLGPEEFLGRSSSCSVRLDDAQVSTVHAVLRWDGLWRVFDKSSTNGTFVDGRRLSPGEPVTLAEGSTLQLGGALFLELGDGGPPCALWICDDGTQVVGTHDFLVLDEDEELWAHSDAVGQWWLETSDGRRPVDDNTIVSSGDPPIRSGRLRLPNFVQPTELRGLGVTIDQLAAHFAVSRDEEHVELTLSHGERRLTLPSRVHHYTLLILARQRLADQTDGRSGLEQGWVDRDDLLTRLRINENLLYTHLFRARRELSSLGVALASQVVERRADSGQLRFGCSEISVEVEGT